MKRASGGYGFGGTQFACGLILALIVVGTFWQPIDPHRVDLGDRFAPPSPAHWLGTDHLGRDVASRLMAGAGPSLVAIAIGLAATLGAGIAAGLVIVFGGGIARFAVQRLAEAVLAVPTLIVALVLGALMGAGPVTAGLALALTAWAPYAITTAALAERVMAEPYWRATLAIGAPIPMAARRHLLPALAGPIRALAGADAGRAVLLVAALGFLGLSADTGRPDWGAMIHEYRLHALMRPLLLIAPIAAIAVLSLALHLALDAQDNRAPAAAGRSRLLRPRR
ncbi:MAG: ABC transporter permease [Pseudomonadota bacterium]